ncbi:GspH/FimT family pseudopilin [Povalibacter sp.]|uniref:GspH/FimT family pseudopilin n=1 Tax=Povalibacter sp. TaxID=1962978 RepID=UPI002F3FF465
MPTRPVAAGFTILELMLTITVAGVLAAVAIPNMRDFIRNNRLTAAANDLLRSTQVARSEAIKRQRNVVVCASSAPRDTTPSCSYGSFTGWLVFEDADNSWHFSDGDSIIERHEAIDTSITVINDHDGILSFATSGFGNPAGAKSPSRNVVICDERGNKAIGDNSSARAVLIEATGRTRVTKNLKEVANALDSVGDTCP